MLMELLESLFTPAKREARRLGYLYETIALKQRYRRRKENWRDHIAKCHYHTLFAADQLGGAGQSILILGSGLLLEIPMNELLQRFDRIVLADFVHSREVRSRWGKHPKVKIVEVDLLGIASSLLRWDGGKLPLIQTPDLAKYHADFILSANCLSQLALKPRQYLEKSVPAEMLDAYSEKISAAHLASIKRTGTPHLVIADFETRVVEENGEVIEKSSPFFDLESLKQIDSWTWNLAPKGEIYKNRSVEMSAGAFTIR